MRAEYFSIALAGALGAGCVALAQVTSGVPWASARPESIALKLSADHEALRLRVSNTGAETLRFWRIIPALDFDIQVRDDKGALVAPNRDRAIGIAPHHAFFLKPGESFSEGGRINSWGYDLKPGQYSVVARYATGWKNQLKSNRVRLDVAQ